MNNVQSQNVPGDGLLGIAIGPEARIRAHPSLSAQVLSHIVPGGQLVKRWPERDFLEDHYKWYSVGWFEGAQQVGSGFIRNDVVEFEMLGDGLSLPAPYYSQLGTGAKNNHNDCGAAGLLMLHGYYGLGGILNVDTIAEKIPNLKGKADSSVPLWQIEQAGNAKDIDLKMYTENNADLAWYVKQIKQRRPSIALVSYGAFSGRQQTDFRGGHYFVVVGYSHSGIVVNDPYWTGTGGENWTIPWHEFSLAIRLVGPYKALASQLPAPEIKVELDLRTELLMLKQEFAKMKTWALSKGYTD